MRARRPSSSRTPRPGGDAASRRPDGDHAVRHDAASNAHDRLAASPGREFARRIDCSPGAAIGDRSGARHA